MNFNKHQIYKCFKRFYIEFNNVQYFGINVAFGKIIVLIFAFNDLFSLKEGTLNDRLQNSFSF
ncbi:hypothetical protein GS518_13875 [Leptospira interrogans]|uniref:Uncharacterized protein n=13 Tax=Leptospira interrogans TaxID=173 RepID=M3GVU4_LEPIR|nr:MULTISPECIES: hypothetical protein [Leptospira]EMG10828.1 hypothetical protein LEP1GSC151_2049 [Leptospira interrogans serovar Grippotyphosa str. LT2186]EMG21310.1 hypothetical protein LEP1GSC150_1898 [Leptospira interrogans serovar Copenhageni str. LT2050]EMM80121.1 hypothetical protein LEP1GSC037_5840 [Leptospira interrogans str. 2006001854]EMN32321.1 hypothetical protein LEP1GSC083_0317 [Leptospira interrogans serovar Pyrogenes str. L0374]EMN72590.1 hypothetical protein LEP1GSC100_0012 [